MMGSFVRVSLTLLPEREKLFLEGLILYLKAVCLGALLWGGTLWSVILP
jgi:hypothetical protein